MILLKIQDAGHGGNSGQYSYLEDLAYEYAFLISSLKASSQPFYSNALMEQTHSLSPISHPFLYKKIENSSLSTSTGEEDEITMQNIRLSNQTLRSKRRGKDEDDKEYRAKKGDRSQNRLFQWFNSFRF